MHENLYDNSPIPYISLFSGYEGIGLGLKRIYGDRLRTIGYCERETFACQNLVEKIEEGKLDAAPIFTDVRTFPWEQYSKFMANGVVSFGFPCQPVSSAGKRKVDKDERWLFDICADGIRLLRPRFAFAENVEGLLSAKMENGKPVIAHVFERLEDIGYTVEAGIFSAAEVGAPHQRKRVFILANRNSIDRRTSTEKWQYDRQTISASSELAHSELSFNRTEEKYKTVQQNHERSTGGFSGSSSELAHSNQPGPQRRNGGKLPERSCKLPPWQSSTRWPARPGEPQYEWEEPRTVVDDSESGKPIEYPVL